MEHGHSPHFPHVVVGLLQISEWNAAVAALAHELHHAGFYTCIADPPPGREAVTQAWNLLASLIAEGSAQVLVDRRPCFALENDFQAINRAMGEAFLCPVPFNT